MKITGLDIYRYKLPFAEPVTLKGSELGYREGLLLELSDDAGASGWGEASPLPGFSRESLDEAEYQLYSLSSSFLGTTLAGGYILPDNTLGGELGRRKPTPSVRFGFGLAVWNLHAISQGCTLPEVLSEKPGTSVSLNGLLTGSGERVLEEARRMLDAGYAAVKLKVGSREVPEDAELVGEVRNILGGGVALRLDANRAWSFGEAVEFCRATPGLRYEYIEEPLAEPAELSRLAEEYGMPVALDESLVGMEAEELRRHRYARAIVLKPTLLGGVSRTMRLAREAGRLGIMPVVSSAYETGIGTTALVSLSANIAGGDIPAGLDTYRRLEADILEPALNLSVPRVSIQEVSDHHTIDRSRLEHLHSLKVPGGKP